MTEPSSSGNADPALADEPAADLEHSTVVDLGPGTVDDDGVLRPPSPPTTW